MDKHIHKRGRYSSAMKENVALASILDTGLNNKLPLITTNQPELVSQCKQQVMERITGAFRRVPNPRREIGRIVGVD